jgi:hypothetical protein
MYRYQLRFEVGYGRARELLEATGRIRAVARDRGWHEPVLWNLAFGPWNAFVFSADYETLAEYEREIGAQTQDADWMGAMREMREFIVQGSVRSEMMETIETLA